MLIAGNRRPPGGARREPKTKQYIVYEQIRAFDGKTFLHVVDPDDYINFGESGHALRVAADAVPEDVKWFFFESLPSDETYRDAWRLSEDGKSIVLDENEARNIAEKRVLRALTDLMESRELTDKERAECRRSRQLIEHTESRQKLEQIGRFFKNAKKRISD